MRHLATPGGIIAAAAMDQRGVLRAAIAKERGAEPAAVPDEALTEFKTAVTRILTPYASAILLDPDFGLPSAAARASSAGLLLSYEADTFLNPHPKKIPSLIPGVTARRLLEWGADAVKILVRYDPFDDPAVNEAKQAFVERVGVECLALDMPYFLEFTGYGAHENRKTEVVRLSMEEFSKPHYHADVLKVEIPVEVAAVQDRKRALEAFRAAAESTDLPFIYLSAGVSHAAFLQGLEWAAEAGVKFNGVLCGRATWQEGIPIYARHGMKALEDWLAGCGVRHIEAINERLRAACPIEADFAAQTGVG